jgi:hypothetical protein
LVLESYAIIIVYL